jgi:hypothetical protein
MKLKLVGGTARGDENLCKTCIHAHRRRYAHNNIDVTVCKVFFDSPMPIEGPVAECSDYRDERRTQLGSMKDIAWQVSVDRRTGKAGFLNPDSARKAEKDGQLDTKLKEVEDW